MAEVDRERLRSILIEKGRTAREVSRKLGENDSLIRDILNGRSRNPRADTMAKVAQELGVALSEIMPAAAVAHVTARPTPELQVVPRFLPVRYRVQAGLWFEMDNGAQQFEGPEKPVSPDPRFGEVSQWLELVEGDSINLRIAPGGHAHVVDAISLGYRPREGDLVVVERRRAQGALRERSIKEVALRAGVFELWPRSTNPRWNAPLTLNDGAREGEEIEVEIVGLVVGYYASFR